MGFLNGLGSLATGLGAFTKNDAADEQARAAVEPTAAPGIGTAAPAAPAAPVVAAPKAAPEAAPMAAAARGGGAIPTGVPPALLPIYEAAAKRTGIPLAVLLAQGKQESSFNVNAVGSSGEIGIAQILPSTARSPGYGVAPVDPSTLRDPTVAINFQADYMRARAGQGADFSHPGTVDAALRAYNGLGGGGDPNYIANVRRHMGGA